VTYEEPRTLKRRKPTTPTHARTTATITRRGSNNKTRRQAPQRPRPRAPPPSTPTTPEQPKWIHPDSSLSPETIAWLKSPPETPVSQFHPHLKALEDANPGLFDRSNARPIENEDGEDDLGIEGLGHVGRDAVDEGSPSHGRERRGSRQPLDEMMQTDVIESIEVEMASDDVESQLRDELPIRLNSELRNPLVDLDSLTPIPPVSPLSKDVVILRRSPLCFLNTLQAFAQVDLSDHIARPLMKLLATVYATPSMASDVNTMSRSSLPSSSPKTLSFSPQQNDLLDRFLSLVKFHLLSNLKLLPVTERMTQKGLRRLCWGQNERPDLADEILLRFLTYLGRDNALRLLSESDAEVAELGMDMLDEDVSMGKELDLGVGVGEVATAEGLAVHKTTTPDLEATSLNGSKAADHAHQADVHNLPLVLRAESVPVSDLELNHTTTSALTSTNTLRQQLQLQAPALHIPAQLITSLRLRKLVIWTWLWLYRVMLMMCLK